MASVGSGVNKDDMIEEEIVHCNKFLDDFRAPLWAKHLTVEAFVARCFTLHRHLIERWNGWRFHGNPADLLGMDDEDSISETKELFDALHRALAILTRNGLCPKDWVWDERLVEKKHGGTLTGAAFFSSQTISEKYGSGYNRFIVGAPHFSLGHYVNAPYTEAVAGRIGQRITSVMVRLLEKNGFGPSGQWPAVGEAWSRFFQQLGETVWISGNKRCAQVAATLSCAPSSFLRLGHYGESSCFHNGGAQEKNKPLLAVDVPDSFVVLFYRDKHGEGLLDPSKRRVGSKVHGRAWGIAVPERGALVTNFYLLKREMVWGSVLQALRGGLGILSPKMFDKVPIKPGSLYLNTDVCFVAGSSSAFKRQFVAFYLTKIIEHASRAGLYGMARADDVVPRTPGVWPYKATLKTLGEEAGSSKKGAVL